MFPDFSRAPWMPPLLCEVWRDPEAFLTVNTYPLLSYRSFASLLTLRLSPGSPYLRLPGLLLWSSYPTPLAHLLPDYPISLNFMSISSELLFMVRVSFMAARHVQIHRTSHLKVLHILTFCYCHLEILNSVWTRGTLFLLYWGPQMM